MSHDYIVIDHANLEARSPGNTGTSTLGSFSSALPGPPALEAVAVGASYYAYSRCVRAFRPATGPASYFCWYGNKIYGLTAAPAWTAVFTVPGQATLSSHGGLYNVQGSDGKPYLLGYYHVGGSNIGVVKYDVIAATWSSFTAATSSAPSGVFRKDVVWQRQLVGWVPVPGGSAIVQIDPVTSSVLFSVPGGTSPANADRMLVHLGRLFLIGKSSLTGNKVSCFELVGGAWVFLTQLDSNNYAIGAGGAICVHGFGQDLIVYFYSSDGATTKGIRAFKLTPSSTAPGSAMPAVELTTSILPAIGVPDWPDTPQDWRYRSGGQDWSGSQLDAVVDTLSNSAFPDASNPAIRLYWGVAAGYRRQQEVQEFNGLTLEVLHLTPLAPLPNPASLVIDDATNFTDGPAGGMVTQVGDIGGVLDTEDVGDGTLVVSYAIETLAAGPFFLKLYHNPRTSLADAWNVSRVACTLKGPVTGGGTLDIPGNRVTGITPGAAPLTTHTVVWDYTADGLAGLQPLPLLMLWVYT